MTRCSALLLISLDSPSNSNEVLNDLSLASRSSHQDDSDFDVEAELPTLDATIPKEVIKKLKPKEKKRQEVINGKLKQSELLKILRNL